jgi:hypothetical protein
MFGDTDGKRDAMLRFTKPVTGGYYFAPSWSVCRRCNLLHCPLPLRERALSRCATSASFPLLCIQSLHFSLSTSKSPNGI